MSAKPTLRVDLGDLDPYFEQRAVAQGMPVDVALGAALKKLLAGEVTIARHPDKRTRRTVTFSSVEEQAHAKARAMALDQPLSTALRAVAIDQLLRQAACVKGKDTDTDVAPSGGMVTRLGVGESPTVRLELRLNPSELAALEDKAQAGRYRSTQALVISIVRAFLLNVPVLDPAVVAALGQHNLELVHISNTVRKLLRELEARKRLGLMETFDVVTMLQRLDAHIEVVAASLALAQGRWVMQAQEA